MSKPGEHKTVQARILHYAQEIGWRYVQRAEAEARRAFDENGIAAEDRLFEHGKEPRVSCRLFPFRPHGLGIVGEHHDRGGFGQRH